MTNKVFSTPYHLWYLPLLVVYPYRNWRERAFFFSIAAIFLGVATSPIPSIEVVKGLFLDTSLPIFTQIPATILLLWGVTRLQTIEPATIEFSRTKVVEVQEVNSTKATLPKKKRVKRKPTRKTK